MDLKADQNFGDENHLSGSINYYQNPSLTGGGLSAGRFVGSGPLGYNTQDSTVSTKGIRVIDDHIISPNLFDTVSVAYNNWHKFETTGSAVDNAALGFDVPDSPAKNNFPIMDFDCVNTFTRSANRPSGAASATRTSTRSGTSATTVLVEGTAQL